GITAFDRSSEADRDSAIAATVGASTRLLDDGEQHRYAELAAFPGDEPIPVRVVADLWQYDEVAAERLVVKLANASLVDLDLRTGNVFLHDVLRAYLAVTLGTTGVQMAHTKILNCWGDPRSLPHEYAWRWIGYHLSGAERREQLEALLADLDWLRAKLDATDSDALIREFDYAPRNVGLRLLQDTLRLSSPVLPSTTSNPTGP